jgi:hypothetical protein
VRRVGRADPNAKERKRGQDDSHPAVDAQGIVGQAA